PGMIPLPMEAGDALFFTENLRHGGYPNLLERVRKTVHLCYAPAWVGSQSPAHWDGVVHVTREAWARYSEQQRALLPEPDPSSRRSPEALALPTLRQHVTMSRRADGKPEERAASRSPVGTIRPHAHIQTSKP